MNKKILLAVCGGIAAYKAAELLRILVKQNHQVRVVMTSAAQQFVTPLTFQALSGYPVHVDLLDCEAEHAMGHIELVRWADLLLVAPATANIIAKFSHGLADDLLSTLFLAAQCPVYLAPAMNQAMWTNPVTQSNVKCLIENGCHMMGPASGSQACGETGPGRMLEAIEICDLLNLHTNGLLSGASVLISAGPTREPLDPVRYISNRSSGKMGYALAQVARQMGASVTLISGPVALSTPKHVKLISVETAEQMHKAVLAQISQYQVYIGAAAVADYAPVTCQQQKIKKNEPHSSIQLTKTKDILADVGALTNRPYVVGFAAETDNLEAYALDKLQRKKSDMIAANYVGQEQGGFDKDQNALFVCWKGGQTRFSMADKAQIASQLLRLIAERLDEKRTVENS